MALIILETELPTDLQTAFDLARSIDFHQVSAARSKERAISGRTTGLIELGERTRWRAKHFGIWQELEIEITEMEAPHYFRDEMMDGAFKYMRHDHWFKPADNGTTIMTDRFEFFSPFGILGKMVDKLVLQRYMAEFLRERNQAMVDYLG